MTRNIEPRRKLSVSLLMGVNQLLSKEDPPQDVRDFLLGWAQGFKGLQRVAKKSWCEHMIFPRVLIDFTKNMATKNYH